MFSDVADLHRIRKVYKLGSSTSKGGSSAVVNGEADSKDSTIAEEMKNLEVQILGLMALRGAT